MRATHQWWLQRDWVSLREWERSSVCPSVRLCFTALVCLYVSVRVLGWLSLCVFETFSLFLWINVCFCLVRSPVQHVWLSQRDSKLSFFHTWSTKQDCVVVCVCVCVCSCVQFMHVRMGPHNTISTPRWPNRSVFNGYFKSFLFLQVPYGLNKTKRLQACYCCTFSSILAAC